MQLYWDVLTTWEFYCLYTMPLRPAPTELTQGACGGRKRNGK